MSHHFFLVAAAVAYVLLPLIGQIIAFRFGFEEDFRNWRLSTRAALFIMSYAAFGLVLGYSLFRNN